MTTRVALHQLLPTADSEENFNIMQNAIIKSARQNVGVCIFPEDFLYGVIRDKEDLENAGKNFDSWVNKFCQLARRYKIDIIPGTFPCYEKGKVYNSAVYISSRGEVLTQYSKTNLWLSERQEYAPSLDMPTVFDTPLGKTAIIICWDIFNVRLFESAIKQGAEWIIVLAFWSTNQSHDLAIERGTADATYRWFSDSQILDALIQTRAMEFNVGIIFSNFAGVYGYTGRHGLQECAISANRTQIMTPSGFVAKITNRKEAVLVCDVDDIRPVLDGAEIFYGRREDIKSSYPFAMNVTPGTDPHAFGK